MRRNLTPITAAAFAVSLPSAVLAHVGHWAPVAGHDHIGIGIAIGIAVVAGLTVLGKRGKSAKPVAASDAEAGDTENDEAQA